MECLENKLLLIRRNTDAGVLDRKRQDAGTLVQDLHGKFSPLGSAVYLNRYFPLLRELEGVGQQILHDLMQADAVRKKGLRHTGRDINGELKPLVLGDRAKCPFKEIGRVGHLDMLRLNGHFPGLDFRQIQDFVDQGQQIASGSIDGVSEFDLLRGEVLSLVF